MVLHERYGLVQHTLDLAAKAAGEGLVALAPDLFSRWGGDKEALRRGEVRVELTDDEVAGMIGDALELLKRHPRVDPARIALIGVCQSGRYPIVVASERSELAACVVLYGAAQQRDWEVTPWQPRSMEDMLGRLQAPALFLFGEADHVISLDEVRRLREVLESHRKSYRMRVFANMPHGWLNATMPGRYRPREAEEAWGMVRSFLAEVFTSGWPPGRVRWEFQSDTSERYDFSLNRRLE